MPDRPRPTEARARPSPQPLQMWGGLAAPAGLVAAQERESAQPIPAPGAAEHAPPEWRETASTVLMFVGAGLLILVVYRMLRRSWSARRKHAADRALEPRERLEAVRERSARAAVVDESMAEAQEFAREIAAMVQNRAARLEALLDRADAAIDRLERLAPTAASAPAALEPEQPAPNPMQDAVYRLADEGRTPSEIAVELGEPVGQVELVLALRRRSSA